MKTLKQSIVAQALANVLISKEKEVTIKANWIPCTQAEMDKENHTIVENKKDVKQND